MKSNKIQWYYHRLRSMSLPELGYRLRQHIITDSERKKIEQQLEFPVSRTIWEHFLYENDVNFFFQWDDRDSFVTQFSQLFPDNLHASIQTATALLAHQINIFDHTFNLGDGINWQQDPFTKRDWPSIFWSDLDIRDGKTIGGVKWVWELNRHHHIVTLGKAYFLSGNDQYASEACTQIIDWIKTNPPLIGINWTSPLEISIRIINWLWILSFIRRSPALTQDRFFYILESIFRQASHIAEHLSAYSSANNHLIGEAAGLALIGIAFPWLPDAKKWRDTGTHIMSEELEKQIYPDGVTAEQAPHYLVFVLDFNLMVWELAKLNGVDIPQLWYDRLLAASQFLYHLMDDQGNIPAIGDSDDAWVVRLDDTPEPNNTRSILATASAILKNSACKAASKHWDEKSHWLLGDPGLNIYNSLPERNREISSHAFRDGGFCAMRAPGRVIVFNCGPLGYLSTAAHGHADALSITISLEGNQVLIDPNTYAYQEGEGWRDYFRSTAAHNTVVINNQNQSQNLGMFIWGKKAKTSLLFWKSTPTQDIAIAEHDGYSKAGITHRRTVVFSKPDIILVIDHFLGRGKHRFTQNWHISANSRLEQTEECSHITLHGIPFLIFPVEMPNVQITSHFGEESPIQGWCSPKFGTMIPSPTISYSGNIDLPEIRVTAICLPPTISKIKFDTLKNKVQNLLHEIKVEVAL